MFGLGLLKGTAIGLTGGIVIGLVIKEACKQMKNKKTLIYNGDPGTIRTYDLLLRRQLLYPAELRGQISL